MKRPTLRFVTSLGAAVLLGTGLAVAASSGNDGVRGGTDDAPRIATASPAATPPLLDAGAVADRLRAAGYMDLMAIEREHGRYEVKARNAQGQRVELYVDARSGEVLRSERDD